MKNSKELAVLFKKIVDVNKEISFIPIKVIEGNYCEEDTSFIDKDGTPYYHIIENPDSYGFCFKDSIINYKKDHRYLTLSLIKSLLLMTIKKYNFTFNIDSETSAPIIFSEKILSNKKQDEEKTILLNDEIAEYYQERFPEFYNEWINKEKTLDNSKEEEDTKEEINIKNLYKELSEEIIDQDETIKNILRLIWRQSSEVENITKNIIIKGKNGVGKSKLFELLNNKIDIPIVTVSSNSYIINPGTYKTMEYIILELIKKANGNIEVAQKGIVIIDKFEELIYKTSPEIMDELNKLLEGTNLSLTSNSGDFTFDTNKLMIIALSLPKTGKLKKTIGFENKEEEIINKQLLDKFNLEINMNDLDYNSYIKILESEKGLLQSNIEFLKTKGVSLNITKPAITEMAQKASKEKFGVKSLDKIIENTLSVAEFEIASNPNLYSELMITEETVLNNKAYTLIRKKNQS